MWKPPADQIETDTGWRPPPDAVVSDKSSQPKQPSFLQTVSNAADRITGTMPAVASLSSPALGMAQYAGQQMNDASGRLGGAVTEFAGRKGIPGVGAAVLGTAASIASNPMTYVNPGEVASGKFAEPVVPAERAFDVQTANKYGLPTTRADLTGSKSASMIETGLNNTITGSGPLQEIARQKLAAIDAAKIKIGQRFGTNEPLSSSGLEAKLSMQKELGGAYQTATKLYKNVPDVPIKTSNLDTALNELDYKNIDKSASSTIDEIKGRLGNQGSPSEQFNPTYSVQGTERQIPTFQKLNDVRNLLSKEIQLDTTYNPIVGNQVGPKGQALIPLKKALDADIQDYVKSNQDTPYGKMESDQFNTSFNKANTFYGAYKNLQGNKLVQKLSRVPESDIPKTVFGSGRIEDVNIAKSALGQKGFNAAKQQFFSDLLESKNIDTQLAKYEPEFLKGVFNSQELNALREAGSLKRTALTAERTAGNPSGTGRVVSSIATGGFLMDALRRGMYNPIHAATEAGLALGGPRLAANAYLAYGKGVPYSLGARSAGAVRATAGAGGLSDESRRAALAAFIDKFTTK